ncbi:hypothetical protein DLM_0747 [Aquitalea magnusonii]|uniref:Uncharacterized protein n=1 Tax=Aquitalea magnusonii TaxID=332411 RepID=A0A3G9GCF0_9NEIS|nr:hypothetical protein DLM_0747 [Aquitalea magnusonii]
MAAAHPAMPVISKIAPGTRVKADTFIAHQTSRFRLMT